MLIGVKMETGLAGMLLMVLLMLIAAFGFIGMSIAIGTKIRKIEHLMLSMQLVIIPMWFLSGGLYPIESMPSWMTPLALVNPMTYATDAMRSVMLRGVIWESLALNIAVMSVFAVSMLILGSLSFKRTIE
jgi:ABC-2 type transport system permease protein